MFGCEQLGVRSGVLWGSGGARATRRGPLQAVRIARGSVVGGAALCAALLALAAPANLRAAEAEAPAAPEPEAPPAATQSARPEALRAVVRGLFVEGRIGGGYMLLNDETPNLLQGGAPTSEELGPGVMMALVLGYDITDAVALQLLAGNILASGDRRDRPRDLGMLYGGAAARLAFALAERVGFLASLGAGFVRASNGIEDPQSGVAILAGVGLEYYVHVRHFSVGLELSALVPTQPWRAFLGLTPMIKYTFD